MTIQAASGKSLQLLLASSNPGKLREYRSLATMQSLKPCSLDLLPGFSRMPTFDESAPTFAENAAGKAIQYSRFSDLPVVADDSGLVVEALGESPSGALGGVPGVHSARYAGPDASPAQCVEKLLRELHVAEANHSRIPSRTMTRRAHFICVIVLALRGRVKAVLSDSVSGEILDAPKGIGGFGYDPVFFFPPLKKTFAELSETEKNDCSHRGKAFHKLMEFLSSSSVL